MEEYDRNRRARALAIVLCLVGIFTAAALRAKSPLGLAFTLELQTLIADPTGEVWATAKAEAYEGIGGFQGPVAEGSDHRLIIRAARPFDGEGTLKVRTPARAKGAVFGKGGSHIQVILGPHKGCSVSCEPITIADVGNLEVRMDLKRAKASSFGHILLRPYDERWSFNLEPYISYRGKHIPCGAEVTKGGWLSMRRATIISDPTSTLSLCVHPPIGKTRCSKPGNPEVGIRLKARGEYIVQAWSETPGLAECEVYVR